MTATTAAIVAYVASTERCSTAKSVERVRLNPQGLPLQGMTQQALIDLVLDGEVRRELRLASEGPRRDVLGLREAAEEVLRLPPGRWPETQQALHNLRESIGAYDARVTIDEILSVVARDGAKLHPDRYRFEFGGGDLSLPEERAEFSRLCERLLGIRAVVRSGVTMGTRSMTIEADAPDVLLLGKEREIAIFWDATDPDDAGWCAAKPDGSRESLDSAADIIALGQ